MKSLCRVINAASIAEPFQNELKTSISGLGRRPVLRGLLANSDPSAKEYAEWTKVTAQDLGIHFELQEIKRHHLVDAIKEANADSQVNGIMNYWPVYESIEEDRRVQQIVTPLKDVEGFSSIFIENLYNNVRFFDPPSNRIQSILPATPLALVKALEHLKVYNPLLQSGSRLYGRTITIINRSEIVGRPLAALCANDGATVYSVDVTGVRKYTRDRLKLSRHRFEEVDMTMRQAAKRSDVVISGVPAEAFKFPSEALKDGAIAINFSSAKNFDKVSIKDHASIYVPSIGKVTIVMLLRNLYALVDVTDNRLRLTLNQENRKTMNETEQRVQPERDPGDLLSSSLAAS